MRQRKRAEKSRREFEREHLYSCILSRRTHVFAERGIRERKTESRERDHRKRAERGNWKEQIEERRVCAYYFG